MLFYAVTNDVADPHYASAIATAVAARAACSGDPDIVADSSADEIVIVADTSADDIILLANANDPSTLEPAGVANPLHVHGVGELTNAVSAVQYPSPRGLVNFGSSCFVNSVVQALACSGAFVSHVQRHVSECIKQHCLMCVVGQLVLKLRQPGVVGAELPEDLMSAIESLSGRRFRRYVTSDSHHFFTWLVDFLRDERDCVRRDDLRGLPVFSSFHYLVSSSVICSGCHNESTRSEDQSSLIVHLDGGRTLEERIARVFATERMRGNDQFECLGVGRCNKKRQATRRVALVSAPDLLNVTIARFTNTGNKIPDHVSFPPFIALLVENAEPCVYNLWSVVEHCGKYPSEGHYVAYCKDGDSPGDRWRKMDDSVIKEVQNVADVFTKQAYMLFYAVTNDVADPHYASAIATAIAARAACSADPDIVADSSADEIVIVADSSADDIILPANANDPSTLEPAGVANPLNVSSPLIESREDSSTRVTVMLAAQPSRSDWVDDTIPLRHLCEVEARGDSRPRIVTLRMPLSDSDATRIADALSPGNDDDVMTTYVAGIRLHRHDTRTLRPGCWLNDEVINLYLELLNLRQKAFVELREKTIADHLALRRSGLPPPKLRPAHVFNSFFWVKLNQDSRGCTVTPPTYTYANVRGWTGQPRKLKIDVFNCSRVIVPINVVHSHWSLGVIFPQQCTIATPDSIGAGSDRVFDLLLQYVKDEHFDKHGVPLPNASEWRRVHLHPCPQQHNGCDCGAFSLLNADLILLGESLDYTQADIPGFRRYVLLKCLNGRIELP